jgi:hypothetical protein
MVLFWGVAWGATLELSPGDDLVGLSESLQPGDELILADGVYQVRNQIVWAVLSSEDAPLTMRPAAGASPIIELTPDENGSYDNDILQIEDSTWVVVEGITFRGSSDWTDDSQNHRGIQIADSSHVTLSGVTIMQTGDTSLYLSGTNADITVTDSHIHSTLKGYGVYIGCYDASCWTSGLWHLPGLHGVRRSQRLRGQRGLGALRDRAVCPGCRPGAEQHHLQHRRYGDLRP